MEQFEIVETAECGDVQSLMDAIYAMCERDPRGEEVAQITAVAIADSIVRVELREFEDGTRTFVLSAVV